MEECFFNSEIRLMVRNGSECLQSGNECVAELIFYIRDTAMGPGHPKINSFFRRFERPITFRIHVLDPCYQHR